MQVLSLAHVRDRFVLNNIRLPLYVTVEMSIRLNGGREIATYELVHQPQTGPQ